MFNIISEIILLTVIQCTLITLVNMILAHERFIVFLT